MLGAKSRRDVACAAKLLVFMGLYFAATLLAGFAIFELAKLLGVNEESVPAPSVGVNAPNVTGNGQSFYHTRFAFESKDKL